MTQELLLAAALMVGMALSATATDVKSYRIESDFSLPARIDVPLWDQARETHTIQQNWQGDDVDDAWQTEVRSLWTEKHLYVLFIANYEELSVDPSIEEDENGDCFGIWDNDVVEMFIGDDPNIRKYYEFVVSPLGQKIDIRHNKDLPKEKSFFTDYTSSWQVRVNNQTTLKRWTCQMKIPWSSISGSPAAAGKRLRANFYRCTGDDKANKKHRNYLALNPTGTETPAFHVPERFGSLVLIGGEELPEPTLHLDFEGKNPTATWTGGAVEKIDIPMRVASSGIAGGDCADFWRFADRASPKPIVLDSDAIQKHLNDIRSMTVTGWLRREADFKDPDATSSTQYVLNCPGRFHLVFDKWSRLALNINGARIYSSWFSTVDFSGGDRWLFFAFTYDGTKTKQNAVVYIGDEKYIVETDQVTDVGKRKPAAVDAQSLVIGAYGRDGKGALRGMVDNIRIYASSSPAKNRALSADQIEAIRREDLGSEWVNAQALVAGKQEESRELTQKAVRTEYWSEALNMYQVGILQRVLSTIPPQPLELDAPSGVMIGDSVAFQFAASSVESGKRYGIHVSPFVSDTGRKLAAEVSTYHVKHVPVEANNNGGIRTSITTRPPQRWREYQIAEAPFKAAEVLIEADQIILRDNPYQATLYQALLVDLKISTAAEPGIYAATLSLRSAGGVAIERPIQVQVYDVKKPEHYALESYHWFWPEPDNVQFDTPMNWWSEEHWRMLEGSMRSIHDFGQDIINIPLINYGRYAAIKTLRNGDAYTFDFTQFDRFFQLALDIGYRKVAGLHILPMPTSGAGAVDHDRYKGIVAWDASGSNPEVLFASNHKQDEWLEFVPTFYQALHTHLTEKGWLDAYLQHQYDEPNDLKLYKRVAGITRKYLPGVETIDAIKTKPEYSAYVDNMVFDVHILRAEAQQLVAHRRAEGQSSWFYHCASPYPPYPNRHLDDPLTSSALYPYLGYLGNADGYLWWAVNVYRGADPYVSSIGPLPSGSVDPGHGPGDNWMFYPGPNGLRPSMRMIAFRHGLSAHTLLKMLARHDKAKADHLAHTIAVDPLNYSTDPDQYYKTFTELLDAVEQMETE